MSHYFVLVTFWSCLWSEARKMKSICLTEQMHTNIESTCYIDNLYLYYRIQKWSLLTHFDMVLIWVKKKSKMKYSSLQTSEPSSNFLHSSFFFLPLETTGWTHECSRLESIVILHKKREIISTNYYRDHSHFQKQILRTLPELTRTRTLNFTLDPINPKI